MIHAHYTFFYLPYANENITALLVLTLRNPPPRPVHDNLAKAAGWKLESGSGCRQQRTGGQRRLLQTSGWKLNKENRLLAV